MMPGENRSRRSEKRREERDEARRVPMRPYVRPSITCQHLAHVVQGTTGVAVDLVGRQPS